MTNLEVFQEMLKSKGFQICNETFARLDLIPTYYKDNEGNRVIIHAVDVCNFRGCNTPKNELGCITLSYKAKIKRKHCRTVEDNEAFKFAKVIRDPDTAISQIESWMQECQNNIAQWKIIM